MKKYSAYKDSGVEWIGEIPEHWECIPLKFIVNERLKYGANESAEDDNPNNPRYIRITDFGFDGSLKDDTFKSLPESIAKPFYLKEGDLLFARSGATVGKTFLFTNYNGQACFAGYLIKASFDQNEISSKYVYYFTHSNYYENWKQSIFQQATIQNIGADKYNFLKVSIPQCNKEQTQIANYLDQKTAEIETLIAKKEQLIKLLEEERTAMINQAVTKGLDPNVPMKDSGIDWLGEIPEHWVLVKLKYLTRIRYGLGQPPKQKEGGLPIIRATNVYRGTISEKNMIYVDPDDLPLNREPILKENDIIVVRSGAYTADSAIIEKKWEGTVTGYDLVMTPKTVNPKLLSFALLSTYMLDNQLFLQRLRAAQPHLNSEELGNTFMLLPPDFEQIDLVDFIENELLRLNEIKEKVKKEIHFLKEYKTALISEVVTGKIDIMQEVLN